MDKHSLPAIWRKKKRKDPHKQRTRVTLGFVMCGGQYGYIMVSKFGLHHSHTFTNLQANDMWPKYGLEKSYIPMNSRRRKKTPSEAPTTSSKISSSNKSYNLMKFREQNATYHKNMHKADLNC
jgi:hypothetical protein